MSLCLDEHELREVTKRRKFKAQIKALRALGIEPKVRSDGSPLVIRSQIEGVEASRQQKHARQLLAHADARLTQKVYRRKPERVRPGRGL